MSVSDQKDLDQGDAGATPLETNDAASRDDGGSAFLKRFGPVLFETAILGAASDEERQEVAQNFAMAPLTDFESIKGLFRLCAHVEHEEHRPEDARVLLEYAKGASKTFLQHRTSKQKQGLCLQYRVGKTVIISVGHGLNEGYVEWLTQRMLADSKIRAAVGPQGPTEKEEPSGTYLIEVRFAQRLASLFGEELLGRAYLGNMEPFEQFMNTVDARLGRGAFFELLRMSDDGEWKQAFSLLKQAEMGVR